MAQERLLLAGFLGLVLTCVVTSDPICLAAPPWQVGGVQPMRQSLGRVTAVTLLQASWSACVDQAANLEHLRQRFVTHGFADVTFLGVNSKHWHSELMASYLEERVQFPVYQAAPDNDVFQILNGRKDDVYVYDRCGRLAYHIPFPKSYTRYGFVESAILSTLLDQPCGPCNTTESPETPANLTLPIPPKETNRDPCDTPDPESPIDVASTNQTEQQTSVITPPQHKHCSWRALGQHEFARVVQRLRQECVGYSFNRWKNRTNKKRQHPCCVLAKDLMEDKCLFTMLSEQNSDESLYQCRCMVSPLDSERNCVCHEATESFTYMTPHRSCMCENFLDDTMQSWDCAPGEPDEPQSCAWRLSKHTLESNCLCRPDFPCTSISTHSWSCNSEEPSGDDSLVVENAIVLTQEQSLTYHALSSDSAPSPAPQSWQCQCPDARPLMQLNELQCSSSSEVLTPPPSCTCCQTSDGIACKCTNHTQVTAFNNCSCEGQKNCGAGSWECRWQDPSVSVCGEKCDTATRKALQALATEAEATCIWQDLDEASWECPQGDDTCSWDIANPKSSWQWSSNAVSIGSPCNWQTSDLSSDSTWQWPITCLPLGTKCQWQMSDSNNDVSWQCSGPELATGASWQWQDSHPLQESPCQWQGSELESEVEPTQSSCQWDDSNSTQSTNWHWQGQMAQWACPDASDNSDCQWHPNGATEAMRESWQWHSDISSENTTWLCSPSSEPLTCQWSTQIADQLRTWDCQSTAPSNNVSWQWNTSCQCQNDSWECQSGLSNLSTCQWQDSSGSDSMSDWSWQPSNQTGSAIWQWPNSGLLSQSRWECETSTTSNTVTCQWQSSSDPAVSSYWQWTSEESAVSSTGNWEWPEENSVMSRSQSWECPNIASNDAVIATSPQTSWQWQRNDMSPSRADSTSARTPWSWQNSTRAIQSGRPMWQWHTL